MLKTVVLLNIFVETEEHYFDELKVQYLFDIYIF